MTALYIPLVIVTSSLYAFTLQVMDGSTAVRGVWAGGWALRVVDLEGAEIATEPDVITLFAENIPTIGLVAHSHLAGKYFLDLDLGRAVLVVRGDGTTKAYRVTETAEYIALEPNSPTSDFIGPDGQVHTARELFFKYYMAGGVTFQTCTRQGSLENGGRWFVHAE